MSLLFVLFLFRKFEKQMHWNGKVSIQGGDKIDDIHDDRFHIADTSNDKTRKNLKTAKQKKEKEGKMLACGVEKCLACEVCFVIIFKKS